MTLQGRKILIADDHALFRAGVALLLESLFDEIAVSEAASLDQVLDRIERGETFDCVLLDLDMPGMDGFRGLDQVKTWLPNTPIVIVSAAADARVMREVIRRGAKGYIVKSASAEAFKHGLSLALAGEIYVTPGLLLEECAPVAETPAPLPAPLGILTPRQLDVLALLMEGRSNKEIGRELGLLESTVKAHVKMILNRLHTSNRTEAAMMAADLGWTGGRAAQPRGRPPCVPRRQASSTTDC
jgi:DNA-binding NarL/FixJ family response regulator